VKSLIEGLLGHSNHSRVSFLRNDSQFGT
jgi:hypothetical protein